MALFIDLDQIAPEPVRVQIGEVVYKLPGDVLVPDYFALDALARKLVTDGDQETVQELHDKLLALFREHQPDMDELPVGPRLLLPLVFRYLNPDEEQEVPEEDADRPRVRASTRTKPATSRRKTPTSRQSSRKGSGS